MYSSGVSSSRHHARYIIQVDALVGSEEHAVLTLLQQSAHSPHAHLITGSSATRLGTRVDRSQPIYDVRLECLVEDTMRNERGAATAESGVRDAGSATRLFDPLKSAARSSFHRWAYACSRLPALARSASSTML